jgi:uncharacterized protein YdbL (DUF1318 family)
MRILTVPKIIALALLLSACVTINVYFPAAAAEKAADRIIEDVWGSDAAKSPPKKSSPQSSLGSPVSQDRLFAALGNVLDFIVPPAHADVDLNISTPAIRALTQSMESRHGELKKYYDSGAVGLTSNGTIEVRDQNAISLAERNTARKLVTDENADRAALYREIAAANHHPEWEADIRSTFAQRWIERASSGWYYQANGAWQRK